MAMLCAFRVHANGQNAEAVTITFGSLPPGAVLEIDFSFDYADGTKRRFGYKIEVETRKVTDVHGDALHFVATGPLLPELHEFRSGERLSGLEVVAPRMVKYGTRMRDASCTIVLRYARNSPNAPVMKGTIPIAKKCAYKILEDSGGVHMDELNSLEIGEEEGEKHGEHEEEGARVARRRRVQSPGVMDLLWVGRVSRVGRVVDLLFLGTVVSGFVTMLIAMAVGVYHHDSYPFATFGGDARLAQINHRMLLAVGCLARLGDLVRSPRHAPPGLFYPTPGFVLGLAVAFVGASGWYVSIPTLNALLDFGPKVVTPVHVQRKYSTRAGGVDGRKSYGYWAVVNRLEHPDEEVTVYWPG